MGKKKAHKFWEMKNSSEGVGELTMYGEISNESWWGDEVTPKEFKADLDALGDINTLNVYINSPGGDVFAGQAIHSMLKRHSASVNVYIDGLAASIASVIAMAGDKVIMPKNAMIMIHKPWSWAVGNSNEFRKLADDLDKIEGSIIDAYEAKANIERNEIVSLVDAETWLSAEECVNKGFADELEETKAIAACVDSALLDKYTNAPERLGDLIKPEGEPSPSPPEKQKDFEVELLKAMLKLETEL